MSTIIIAGKECLYDEEDYKLITSCSLTLGGNNKLHYLRIHSGGNKGKLLHRILMNVFDRFLFVDHINRNPLDNQKSNLRIVTPQQSAHNRRFITTNKFPRGVRITSAGRYTANIVYNYHQYNLGTYRTIEEASAVHEAKRKELFGEFA